MRPSCRGEEWRCGARRSDLNAEGRTERLHMPAQPVLPMADGGQRLRALLPITVKPQSVRKLMDVHSPHPLRRLWWRFAAGGKDAWERGPGEGTVQLAATYSQAMRRVDCGLVFIAIPKVGMVYIIPVGITEIFSHCYGHTWRNVKKGALLRCAIYCSSKRVS